MRTLIKAMYALAAFNVLLSFVGFCLAAIRWDSSIADSAGDCWQTGAIYMLMAWFGERELLPRKDVTAGREVGGGVELTP